MLSEIESLLRLNPNIFQDYITPYNHNHNFGEDFLGEDDIDEVPKCGIFSLTMKEAAEYSTHGITVYPTAIEQWENDPEFREFVKDI